MKVLHTADWHIGKVLHKHELREEMILFFDWLISIIEEEAIDVLLISGDIFDLANPAVKDRELYYKFLSRLLKYEIKVIITGGNHDAVGLLNAPEPVLKHLNISIIGGATKNIADELIPVANKKDKVELVVAAVPFLRDRDLRNRESDKQHKNRIEAIRAGIKNHYAELAALAQSKYPNIPSIAMGHLYASGSVTSESEREIHIGNAAAVDSAIFADNYDYIALGHIHRPQIIGKSPYVRYSGSPIALSFSEREDKKCIIIVEIENNKIQEPRVLTVPKQRELLKIKGTEQEVVSALNIYKPQFSLPSFVELDINEEHYSPLLLSNVDNLVASYEHNDNFQILKSRVTFNQGGKDTSDLFAKGTQIDDITPMDVFKKMLDQQQTDTEDRALLTEAFSEILEETLEADNA